MVILYEYDQAQNIVFVFELDHNISIWYYNRGKDYNIIF